MSMPTLPLESRLQDAPVALDWLHQQDGSERETPEEQLVRFVTYYVSTLWDMGWIGRGTLLISIGLVACILWDNRPEPGPPATGSPTRQSDPRSAPSAASPDCTTSNEPLWPQDQPPHRPLPANGIATAGPSGAPVVQFVLRWLSESEEEDEK